MGWKTTAEIITRKGGNHQIEAEIWELSELDNKAINAQNISHRITPFSYSSGFPLPPYFADGLWLCKTHRQ
jgi:hypothetical protein